MIEKNKRSLSWLLEYVVSHGVTFDGTHSKWTMEQVSPSISWTW